MVAPKTVWKTILESILVAELVLMPLFIPLAARAQDFPMDSPSDPGGLDEFPSTGSGGGTGSGSGFSLGSLGGILSSSGVSCGGSGGAGGVLGSIFGSALGSVGNIFGGFLGGSGGGVGGALGGILGGSTGGALGGVLGGVMGGGEVPVNDKTVRNETGRIRTNTGEIVKKECVLDPIVKAITAVLLKTLGNRVVSWVQKSDVGFIQNYEAEFRKIENQHSSEFAENIAKTQMGNNINPYVNDILIQAQPGQNKLFETFT